MRQLMFLATLFFVTAAAADEKLDAREVDKSSTSTTTSASDGDYNNSRSNNLDGSAPADDEHDPEDNPGTRAQDYNSSRSNTTSAKEDKAELHKDTIVHRDVATRNMQTDGDDDDDNEEKATEYQDGEDLLLRKRPGR